MGRLSPGFALSVNPQDYAATGPASVLDDELAGQRFERLEAAGWRVGLDVRTVSSPGGLTRSEVPPSKRPGRRTIRGEDPGMTWEELDGMEGQA